MRPSLKAGLVPVWRDRGTLQIGIDSRRAIALTGMTGIAWFITLLDGSRDRDQVISDAAEGGIPPPTAERVLALLVAAGAIDDFPAATLRVLPQQARSRLAAELATVSLARRSSDGGAHTLARRTAAQVSIYGGGRIAAALGSLLTTSGIGSVTGAAGRTDDQAAAGGLPAGPRLPDLAVLASRPQPDLQAWLMREQLPHLAMSASEAIGIVGPLVIPGQTACLRCLDLARTDRDPAWPLILAQLAGRPPDPLACDAPLTAAVAAQAALQVLTLIDQAAITRAPGAGPPAAAARTPGQPAIGDVTNGTLELVLPGWQWRRRTWAPHARCSCRGCDPEPVP